MESHPPDAPRTRPRGRLFLVLGIGLLAAAMVVSALPLAESLDPVTVPDQSSDPEVRLTALVGQLRSPDAETRNAGVAGLAGSWMLSRDFPGIVPEDALVRCLQDGNEMTRRNAALTLAYLPSVSPGTTERLVEMLMNDPDPRVRSACAAAVAWSGSNVTGENVRNLLDHLDEILTLPQIAGSGAGPAGDGPMELVNALGLHAVQPLLRLVEGGSAESRAAAWRGLGRLAWNEQVNKGDDPGRFLVPVVVAAYRVFESESDGSVCRAAAATLDQACGRVPAAAVKSLLLPDAYRRLRDGGRVMDEGTGVLLRWALHSDPGLWSDVERLAASEVAAERLAAVKAAESPVVDPAAARGVLEKLRNDANEDVSRAAGVLLWNWPPSGDQGSL